MLAPHNLYHRLRGSCGYVELQWLRIIWLECAALTAVGGLEASRGQTFYRQPDLSAGSRLRFHRHDEALSVRVPLDRVALCEARSDQLQIDALSGCAQMQAAAHAVLRYDLE